LSQFELFIALELFTLSVLCFPCGELRLQLMREAATTVRACAGGGLHGGESQQRAAHEGVGLECFAFAFNSGFPARVKPADVQWFLRH